jgi:D-3-phosphoglycerate dehydrogenase
MCTPHLGASTAESEEKCATMAVSQLKKYLEYGIIANSVNFPALEMFPSQEVCTRLAIVNKDVPNMIGAITSVIGSAGVNICAFTNESNGKVGYNLVDVGVDVNADLIERIQKLPDILRIRVIRFSK